MTWNNLSKLVGKDSKIERIALQNLRARLRQRKEEWEQEFKDE